MAELKDLLDRVRAGDQEAAAELVREYEPKLRGIIRTYLNDPRIRRVFGPDDFCQSIFFKFLQRVQDEGLGLESSRQLLAYFVSMVKHKVFSKLRWCQAGKRDVRRTKGQTGLEALPGHGRSPSEIAIQNEELANARLRVSESDWFVLRERAAGRTFPEIGAAVGSKTDAVRMKHDRALRTLRGS